jgi:hypothetical protein
MEHPSVTLFLVALANIVKQVQEPVDIVGYADDWASDQDMKTAQTNIQSALNNLSKWRRRKRFAGKTIAMHICRKRKHDHPDQRTDP